MKNFARIIDLGECECIAYRSGYTEVHFQFWLNGLAEEDEVIEPSAKMDFQLPEVVERLFTAQYADKLREKAAKAYAEIKKQFGELMEPTR